MKFNAVANPNYKNILVDCKLLRRLGGSKHRITVRGFKPFVKTKYQKEKHSYLVGVLYKEFIEFDILIDGLIHHQIVNYHEFKTFNNIKTLAINNVIIATRDSIGNLVTTGKAWREFHDCTAGVRYKKIR